MTTSSEIRKSFLDYFNTNGHEIVSSSPVVPKNDPTLLFTNAGMVQFKNVFTGVEQRAYTRATTSQKCIRAGGKHNDLENVGFTARHHTFFEMLGNFSFGDYFKEEAIFFAWDLLTKVYGISKEKLYITVFSEDDDAFNIWKKITGFSDSKIIRIPTSDNFWTMGDTGPCGPCSEIFYDHGDHIKGGLPGTPEEDGDRFVEIWNIVFMQYEQISKEERISLPKPSIDTGMGLERISAILQGVHDNYDTDILKALCDNAAMLTVGTPTPQQAPSLKVIADHLRSSSFLIADGILPSNEGRGYVLRRIMRRAMRHAHLLGAEDPLLYKLVNTLSQKMGDAYPELYMAKDLIEETLRAEEVRFRETLVRGLKILDEETKNLSQGSILPGNIAFKLYDTYGFPLDLTQDALKSRNISVDEEGFKKSMDLQKKAARAAWAGSGEAATEAIWFDLYERLGATEFLGYSTEEAEGEITALVKNGEIVEELLENEEGFLISNQTPFYAESGGQVGDKGRILGENFSMDVLDTIKKHGDLFIHNVKVTSGTVDTGAYGVFAVDVACRQKTRANHSATHLLHEALRRRFGPAVSQKGSIVTPEKLRLDFSLNKAPSKEDLLEVEKDVFAQIISNTPATTRVMSPENAMKEGAMALFGEKYGEEVRVVSMGSQDEENKKSFSIELCRGTHVARTGDIGAFKIISEGSVSAGVRRIEAATGQEALAIAQEQENILHEITDTLKTTPSKATEKIISLFQEKKKLESDLRKARQSAGTGASLNKKKIGDIHFISEVKNDFPVKDLRSLMDQYKNKFENAVIALFAINEEKVSALVGLTSDMGEGISAKELISYVSEALGGSGGGGRPDLAQCGGNDPSKITQALKNIEEKLSQH